MKPTDYPFWFKIVAVTTVFLFFLNLAFFAAPIHVFAAWALPLIGGHDLLAGLGTVAASFFGAMFAFGFAWYQRRRERGDENVTAGNVALFTLGTMWNVLNQFQKEFVNLWRGKPDRWLNFHLGPPLQGNLSFDMKGLSFLLKGAGGTYQRLLLEEQRYRLVAYAVEEHRRLILHEAWPRMEAAGMSLRDQRTEDEMIKIIGTGNAQQLRITVEAIMTNVDEDLKSLKELFVRLKDVLQRKYPRETFVDFSF